MKLIATALFVLVFVAFLLSGFFSPSALVNSSFIALADGGEAYGATEDTACAASPNQYSKYLGDVSASGWRPAGGIIDGQGCLRADVSDSECARCYCDPPFNQNLSDVGPYFVFSDIAGGAGKCRGFLGGQLIFEGRGYNGIVVLPLMLGTLVIGIMMALLVFCGVCRSGCSKRVFPTYTGNNRAVRWLIDMPFGQVLQFSRGQWLGLLWLVLIIGLGAAYLEEHARINNLVGKTSRSLGGAMVVISALLLVPAGRHSILMPTLGISFDRSLSFHRIMGLSLFVLMGLHGLLMFIAYVQVYHRGDPRILNDGTRTFVNQKSVQDSFLLGLERMTKWGVGFPHGPPLAGLIAFGLVFIMVIAASFRRAKWNAFAILHLLYVPVYALIWIHYPTTILLSFPSVSLHLIDALLRIRSSRRATLVSACYLSEALLTRIEVHVPNFGKVHPGQFVVLRLPQLESFAIEEQHPFSIASYNDAAKTVTLYVRNMGAGTFTHALARNADALIPKRPISIQGPYGALKLDPRNADTVILTSAGIGVTPMMLMLSMWSERRPLGLKRIEFIWTFRGREVLSPFVQQIEAAVLSAKESGLELNLLLYDSSSSPAHPLLREGKIRNKQSQEPLLEDDDDVELHAAQTKLLIRTGRPPLKALIEASTGVRRQVYTCGPPIFVGTVLNIARTLDLPTHEETFLF